MLSALTYTSVYASLGELMCTIRIKLEVTTEPSKAEHTRKAQEEKDLEFRVGSEGK